MLTKARAPSARALTLALILALPATGSVAAEVSASEEPAVNPDLPARLPLNELRVFAEAFNRVSSAYVEEINDKELLESAIRGMLSQLDPHSAYLDQDSFSSLQETTTGNYGGLGLEVGLEDGFVRVISPMDDTPADKAGLRSGDLIIELDDKPVKGMSLNEAIENMRGEPGSAIKLTVLRNGESAPNDVTITREVIKVASVRHRIIEDGFGYLRIAQFQSGTGPEVGEALTALQESGPLRGLVMDLRNNPGGVLQAAVDVSDLFVSEGLIVYTTGRVENADLKFTATAKDTLVDVPIVILVNEGTASASEIVAGALQDHQRAVIMGTTTFGKGSVQTILPLNNEKAIKLTTALYFTPGGRSIQAEGIVPDIWVDRSTVTKSERSFWRPKEKDLPNHLNNADHPEGEAPTEANGAGELASQDYQLNEALTLLKGLNILARKGASGT
ncbi:MAG: S41 family peptidase [Proteobacteria bacterium]|jgi:carboxyl-terminal processing protease|nr:S41 family peptidase [Pseudomonadota bacterium]MDA1298757.1 S41 family peptidase [Pseudomonadota bacterium]